MIQAVKHNKQARQEYRFMSRFEMDTREKGRSEDIAQGIQQGFADGAYQTKLETAKLMRAHNYPITEICEMTSEQRFIFAMRHYEFAQ